jgi:hypothetical protein
VSRPRPSSVVPPVFLLESAIHRRGKRQCRPNLALRVGVAVSAEGVTVLLEVLRECWKGVLISGLLTVTLLRLVERVAKGDILLAILHSSSIVQKFAGTLLFFGDQGS